MKSQQVYENSWSQPYNAIIVGAGFAGSILARECAERLGWKVALIERRDHIAGNMYDYKTESHINVHAYGPHIFHTDNERVYTYLSRFTEWAPYEHRVLARVGDEYLPVPFNYISLVKAFGDDKSELLRLKLDAAFGAGSRVTLKALKDAQDPDLSEVADYVYKNIFLHYTMKQWGKDPDEVNQDVVNRVPILLSEDDRYFQDTYQGLPLNGYTALFENLLRHDLIDIFTGVDARNILSFEDHRIQINGSPYGGVVIYSGALDELFGDTFGMLPYRSVNMVFEDHETGNFQPVATVNYTVSEDFTRITEFKKMTFDEEVLAGKTTILKEYPCVYKREEDLTPYYPLFDKEPQELYQQYAQQAEKIVGFHALGRLAQYRYYDMDDCVDAALLLADELVERYR